MSRRDVDEFLARSEAVLTEPEPALAGCAWCSRPLDDASPSGEFCGERCASYWRAGLDWTDEERCACRTCDPDGPHHYGFTPGQRRVYSALDPLMRTWLDSIRAASLVHVDTSAVERSLAEVERRLTHLRSRQIVATNPDDPARVGTALHRAVRDHQLGFSNPTVYRRAFLGMDVAGEGQVTVTAARYDDAGNLVVDTDLSGWTDMGYVGEDSGLTFSRDGDEADLSCTWSTGPLLGAEPTMVIYDEVHHWVNPRTWLPAGIYDEAPTTRWMGRKPNRKRRRRRS